jgi:hypothetical protein
MVEMSPKAEAGVSQARSGDLLLRLFEATDLAPGWIGLAIGLAWVAATWGVSALAALLGDTSPVNAPRGGLGWGPWIIGAIIGYIPVAYAHLHRGAQRDLSDLRPVLRCTAADFEAQRVELGPPARWVRWLATGLGALLGLGIAFFDPAINMAYRELGLLDPRFLWFELQNAAFVALGVRMGAAEIRMTRAYARIGEELVAVDLLDLEPLAPFVRKGQRSVVLWVVLSMIFSAFWIEGSAGSANALVPILLIGLLTAAFVLPVVGVHKTIRAAKRAELDRIRQELRGEREAMLRAREAGQTVDAGLANLVAYRSLVESTHEWPFDLPALARFALFAAIGAGSWLGGALVERLLGAALD